MSPQRVGRMQAGRLLLLLRLVCVLKDASGSDSYELICNSDTPLGQEATRMVYARFPITDACSFCDDRVDLARSDQTKGLNARVPMKARVDQRAFSFSKIDYYAEYTFTVNPMLSTFDSMDGVRMIWTAIVLDEPYKDCTGVFPSDSDGAATASRTVCAGDDLWMFAMPGTLLGSTRLTLNLETLFLNGVQALTPELTLAKTLGSGATSVLRSTNGPSGLQWGISVPGCVIPQVVVRVEWVQTTGQVSGDSIPWAKWSARSEVDCWTRVLRVVRVNIPTMYSHDAMLCVHSNAATMNALRKYMQTYNRDQTRSMLTKSLHWAQSVRPTGPKVLYSEAMANRLLDCASPESSLIGGSWLGFTSGTRGTNAASPGKAGTPGACVPCTANANQETLRQDNRQSVPCNRTTDTGTDCCSVCRTGFMEINDACVPRCRPGTYYASATTVCVTCAVGLYSGGNAETACAQCSVLGYSNAYVDVRRGGCVTCGAKASAVATTTERTGYCKPCPTGKFVRPMTSQCVDCTMPLGYYLPAGGTECVACPPGTYMSTPGDTECSTCASNTYSSASSATACLACGNGRRHASNYTTCVACPALNTTRLRFAEYFEPGCRLRCNPSVSYLLTNPLVPGGCGDCNTVTVPIGRYRKTNAPCTESSPCTNKPSPNAVYTSASPTVGVSDCAFKCNAGYAGSNCAACTRDSTFNVMRHVWVDGCTYTCRPGLFVDHGATPSCTTPCIDLRKEYDDGRVYKHAHDYTAKVPRPYYRRGVCGSSERVVGSTLPALRLAKYVYNMSSADAALLGAGAFCGDSFLNVNEACDDGNRASNDGCSATCTIETNRYWDCDLVGEACAPNCGWPDRVLRANNVVLPVCNGDCNCSGWRYSELQGLPLAEFGGWIAKHFVSCSCGYNAKRALSTYDECTAANQGCRPCGARQYHHDLYGRCVHCGSACAKGFKASGPNDQDTCGPTVATSQLLEMTDPVKAQSFIGCVPCTAPFWSDTGTSPEVKGRRTVWVENQTCVYACRRASNLLPDAFTDTYCNKPVDNVTGACVNGGQCQLCYDTYLGLKDGGPVTKGHYLRGCIDGVGYAWTPCDARVLPVNAKWSSNAEGINAATGCKWTCNDCPNYQLYKEMQCLPCKLNLNTCPVGFVRKQCCPNSGLGRWMCVPCDAPLPSALQMWTSSDADGFLKCHTTCTPGIGFSVFGNGTCSACTPVVCRWGEQRVPCAARSDARCEECAPLPEHEEFMAPGDCATRCVAGYYRIKGSAVCFSCNLSCSPGQRPSSTCESPTERGEPPACVDCAQKLEANMKFVTECDTACVSSSYMRNPNASEGGCVLCDLGRCAVGEKGECVTTETAGTSTTTLVCTPCGAAPYGARYAVAGSCTILACVAGFEATYNGGCQKADGETPATPTSTTPAPVAVAAGGRLPVNRPMRSLRHS
jgi:cysteine-rich repeat protein